MRNLLKITLILLVFACLFACSTDQRDNNTTDQLTSEKQEKAMPIFNSSMPMVGSWVRSFEVNGQSLEVGFSLNENHTINLIRMNDENSKYWMHNHADSLEFYEVNTETNDTTIAKKYFIELINETTLILIPRNAQPNYKEFYTRK